MEEVLRLYAVGDILPDREDPETIFAHVASTVKEADIAFCQLETNLSDRGSPNPQFHSACRSHPRNVRAITSAGFNVVSCAGNHTLDWGYDAMFDTLAVLRENGIHVIGAGKDLDEARKPAIIEKKGTRVAFLAYNSILPAGYAAAADKAGCAPIRVSTYYEPYEYQPGTPCCIVTIPNKQDVEGMIEDIAKARAEADLVVVSLHWGLHMVPATIAAYETEVGHAAIDAGADLILGHHAHILKPIEVYKGKVIFHCLCMFGFDSFTALTAGKAAGSRPGGASFFFSLYGYQPDPEYRRYPFHPDAKKSVMVKCLIKNKKIDTVSLLPVFMNKESEPEFMPRTDKRSDEVFEYLQWLCKDFSTRLERQGDEILIQVQ